MINSGLFVHSAAEAGTGDSDESPPAVVVDDERTSAVSQTGVHLAPLVSGAEHLLVELKHPSQFGDPARPDDSPELGCSCPRATGCSPRF